MRYKSTRGKSSGLSFEQAVFQGLAPDGGLYIPETIPQIPISTLEEWSKLSFTSLSYEILRKFIDTTEIPNEDLENLINNSYKTFDTPEIIPIKKLKNNLYLMELFHGPTYAFKDIALQLLGNLFEYFLEKKEKNLQRGEKIPIITVLGATSGDTGSAAIYALKRKKNVYVFILHPTGRVSNIQEAQMNSVLDFNIFNVSVEGTFDDCQEIVKNLFSDLEFKKKYSLGAINSINWARILAQTVYYFYSFFQISKKLNIDLKNLKIDYSVPTGNFGDILAGYYAMRMGLPINKLIIATNENDILYRFIQTGKYEKLKNSQGLCEVKQTLSPSMDILVSSNFERLIWYLAKGDDRISSKNDNKENENLASEKVTKWMNDLKIKGNFEVENEILEKAKLIFDSFHVNDIETTDAIARYYHVNSDDEKPYVLDPHSAVGVVAAEKLKKNDVISVCLATAHPGKFPDAIMNAINNYEKKTQNVPISYENFAPKPLIEIKDLPMKCIYIKTDGKKERGVEQVRNVIHNTMESFNNINWH